MFIAERFRCKSHILFQSSGVSFLLDDARPVDYFAVISEDAHVGSIVQVRSLADNCCCNISNRPHYEALGNKYRVCGVYSPEPPSEVYCLRLNFNISKFVY